MLHIIDCKFYRTKTSNKNITNNSTCVINFQNKAIEYIKLSKVLNKPDIIVKLSKELQNKENRSVD